MRGTAPQRGTGLADPDAPDLCHSGVEPLLCQDERTRLRRATGPHSVMLLPEEKKEIASSAPRGIRASSCGALTAPNRAPKMYASDAVTFRSRIGVVSHKVA